MPRNDGCPSRVTSLVTCENPMAEALNLRAHIDAALSQAQLEELASRLTEKRRELTERMVNLEQQIVIKDDCSLADAADAASLSPMID